MTQRRSGTAGDSRPVLMRQTKENGMKTQEQLEVDGTPVVINVTSKSKSTSSCCGMSLLMWLLIGSCLFLMVLGALAGAS